VLNANPTRAADLNVGSVALVVRGGRLIGVEAEYR
jgi:hypothetical protein